MTHHATERVLVVFQELPDSGGPVYTRVVWVETEQVISLLDPGVQGPTVTPETDGKNEVVLGRVPVEPEKRSDFEKYDRNAVRVLYT